MPSSKTSQIASPEDGPIDRTSPLEHPTASPRLQHIAHALQVPLSALYGPPNAISQASSSGADTDAVNDDREDECTALLRAYQRIHNSEERRRLLALVQSVADRI